MKKYPTKNHYPINTSKLYNSPIGWEPIFKSASSYIEIGQDGISPVVPIGCIKQILVENEMLREELCEQQNDVINNVYQNIKNDSSHSKQEIQLKIHNIVKLTNGVITENEIWRLITDTLISQYDVTLMKPNESIIEFIWRLDLLPLLSFYVRVFEQIITIMEYSSTQSLTSIFKSVSKGLKTNSKYKLKI